MTVFSRDVKLDDMVNQLTDHLFWLKAFQQLAFNITCNKYSSKIQVLYKYCNVLIKYFLQIVLHNYQVFEYTLIGSWVCSDN